MRGMVGSIRLHAVGDVGHGGTHVGGTALYEAEHHLFDTVIETTQRAFFWLARRSPRFFR